MANVNGYGHGMFKRIEDAVLILLLTGMVFLSFLQIVLRNVFDSGIVWIDPLVRQMLLWVTLVGSMVATREGKHITVDAVNRFLPEGRLKQATACVSNIFASIVSALLTWSTFIVFYLEYQDPTGGYIMKGLPLWASLAFMPLAFGVITLRFVRFSVTACRKLMQKEHEVGE